MEMINPFQSSTLATHATGALQAASQYAQRKRAHAAIVAKCVAVNLDFEPIVLENLGVWVVLNKGLEIY